MKTAYFKFLFIVLFVNSIYAQDKQKAIGGIAHKFHEYGYFSGTIIVAKKGEIIYQDAIGLANREWNIPHVMDSKFIIGSLSK